MPIILLECILFSNAQFSVLTPVPDDSVTFAIKINCSVLNPADTSYQFCAWIYDTSANHYISQIWTPNGWKSGWTQYQPFYSDTGTIRNNWMYLRLYKEPTPASFYISLKYINSDTEQIKIYYPDFRILDMKSEAGWLQGIVYKDSLCASAYPGIIAIAKDTADKPVGCYISENNNIDEGNVPEPGWFSLASPVGTVKNLEFEDIAGNKINAYVKNQPPWEIKPYDTTFIETLVINKPSSKPVLTIQPSVFSPNRSDSNVTHISFILPFNQASVKLYIYDRNGRCVKKLLDNCNSMAQSRYIWQDGIIWDGKSDSNEWLPTGIYIVYLEAKDRSSTKSVSTKSTMVFTKFK